ncbi:MAG: PAS domain S-box protein [Sterolibacterium sp.]
MLPPPAVSLLSRLKFRMKLLLGVAFLNGFVIALGGLSLYESYQQHQKRAEATSQNIARMVEEELTSDFEKVDLSLLSVVDEIDRQMAEKGKIDEHAINKLLVRLKLRMPEVDSLRVADATGRVRYGTGVLASQPVSIADREYFIRQRDRPQSGLVVTQPLLTRIDRKWAIPVSRRLSGLDGSFAGIVYANVSVEHINQTFAAINVGRNGSVALRNEELALVARHPMLDNRISEIGTKVFFPEIQALMLAGQTTGTAISRYPADNIERCVSFRKLSAYPFYILIGLAVDDYLADWRFEAAKTSSAVAFFILITLLSSWWICRSWKQHRAQQRLVEEQSRQIAEDVVALQQVGLKARKLAQAVKQSPAIVVITDVHGNIEYVNPKFTEVTGYTAEEALGRNPRLLKSGLTPPEVYRDLWAAILAGQAWQGELLNRKKSGELIWENTRISPLIGENGKISHFIAVKEDITQRKAAEVQMRKLSQAVEQSPAIVVITDVHGSIEYVNPKFTEVTGYTSEEALGQNPRILKSGLTPPEVYRGLWSSLQAGQAWHGELLNRKKNGELIWENTWISPLTGEDGKISHFITVKEDITQRKAAEAQMRKLSLAVEHSPSSVVITDRNGTIEYVNPKFTEASGYSASDAIGNTPGILSSGLTPAETYHSLWARISSGQEWSGELLNRNKKGELFWESERIAPITNEQGEITHFVALKSDITERKQAEAALHLSNSAIEASSNGILVIAARGAARPVLYANPAFEQMTGYDAADTLGKDIFELLGTQEEPVLSEYLSSALRQGEKRCSVVPSRHRDGSRFWNEFAITVVRNAEGVITNYVGVLSDVTSRIEYEDQLSHQANHDDLTGLANRSLLMDRIRQAIANAHRYGHSAAVLLVDLDHFKYINDSMGHAAGDQVVRQVAQRLSGCAREGDTVARMGGDEFVLVLNRVEDEQDVARVLERIVDSISKPMRVEGRELHITSSLGASLFPKDGDNPENLLRYADTAMYRAKEQGRDGYWFYTADMNTRMMERLTLEGNLRHALENQEFILHYQPQVDIRSGRIVGAEALIRWQSTTLGMVSPAKFIPLAEETGLIIPIGDWVLASACQQIKRWQAAGLPRLRVAVNISASQFRQKSFAERLAALLEENRLDAANLELEITESMLMHDIEEAIAIMRSLKAIDLHLSLDDFGTGFSSLSYLKRFPIDVLKLDQSFVRDVLVDPDDATIARTVIGLGHSLNLKVVAEGVETAEQLTFMQTHDCDLVQGYYFSRPLPADDFAALLKQGLAPALGSRG